MYFTVINNKKNNIKRYCIQEQEDINNLLSEFENIKERLKDFFKLTFEERKQNLSRYHELFLKINAKKIV